MTEQEREELSKKVKETNDQSERDAQLKGGR